MQNVQAISLLKLRAGYGSVGYSGIGNYDWQPVILENTQYVLNNTAVDAAYFNAISNPDLKWEISKTTNIGFDLGLLKNKFTLSADYFNKMTDNLILDVPIGPSLGYTAAYPANVGKMRNRGVEFELGYHINSNDFASNLTGNISFIRNKVISLATPTATIDRGQHPDYGGYDITRTVAGQPIQSFYGWVTDGIFQQGDDMSAQPDAAPGDIRFKDLNGDGTINSEDRTFIGSYLPKFSYGLNYGGSYKGLDFDLFFQGTYGNKIYNGTKVISQGMVRLFGASTEVLNAWTPQNTGSDIPRAISGDPNGNTRTSDRFVEDGSYLRLKSVSIGYSLPTNVMNAMHMGKFTSIRIYVSGQNLLTFTKYTGYDPEVGAQIPINNDIPDTNDPSFLLRTGIDYCFMPSPRSVIGGIQINF